MLDRFKRWVWVRLGRGKYPSNWAHAPP